MHDISFQTEVTTNTLQECLFTLLGTVWSEVITHIPQ